MNKPRIKISPEPSAKLRRVIEEALAMRGKRDNQALTTRRTAYGAPTMRNFPR
jgi:hypothetical protein